MQTPNIFGMRCGGDGVFCVNDSCAMALHLRWNVLWQQFDTTIWHRLLLFCTLNIPVAVAVAHNSISPVCFRMSKLARTQWTLISLDETIHPYKWLSLWLASCVVSFDFQVIRSNSLSMYPLPHGHRTKYSSPFTVYIDAVTNNNSASWSLEPKLI